MRMVHETRRIDSYKRTKPGATHTRRSVQVSGHTKRVNVKKFTDAERADLQTIRATGRSTRDVNVIYGSLHDNRANERIAHDMSRDAREVVPDPIDWHPDQNDLKGWDTTHITKRRKDHAQEFEDTRKELNTMFPEDHVEGRVKTMPSVVKKLKKTNRGGDHFTDADMYDISGLRVTFDDTADLMRGAERIKSRYPVRWESDNVTNPRPNGYRGYHLIIVKDGVPMEVQLRTKSMTVWGEWTHNTTYDHREATKKRIGEKAFKETDQYSMDMAGYYKQKDEGKSPKRPVMPPSVQRNFNGMNTWAEWTERNLYINRDETRRKMGKRGFRDAENYSQAMVVYYSQKDHGGSPRKPAAPESVKEHLGEMKG